MMKVKITKNVIHKSTSPLGGVLNPRMIIFLGIGFAAAAGTFFGLKDSMSLDLLMWIVFLELAFFAALGIQINGISLMKYLFGKKIDKRPFNRKGVNNDELF